MKTAMQKFISGIDTYETDETMTILHRMERAENFIEVLRKRAYLLLEAEKEQIDHAFAIGYEVGYDDGKYDTDTDLDYYQKTFKSDE